MNRIMLCTVALAGFLSVGPIQAEEQGKKVALVVGVGDYQHAKFGRLQFAENDAVELSGVLTKAGYEVRLLCDSAGKKNADLKPTRANILKHLDGMLKGRTRHDMVLVSLAGHGLQLNKENDNFFCPVDADPGDQATLINVGDLFRTVDASGAGVKLMLIDACRDSPALSRMGLNEENLPKPAQGTGVLFSCKSGERAFEMAKLKHGVFTHFVLKGLRGEAANRRGEVTWGLLVEYVQREVAEIVPKEVGDGAQQSPNVKSNLAGKSPVLLKTVEAVEVRKPVTVHTPEVGTDSEETSPLHGGWVAAPNSFYIKPNGTLIWFSGDFYLQGQFTFKDGVITLLFPGLNWNWKAALTFDKQVKGRLLVKVLESNMPGTQVGGNFSWQRTTRRSRPLRRSSGQWSGNRGGRPREPSSRSWTGRTWCAVQTKCRSAPGLCSAAVSCWSSTRITTWPTSASSRGPIANEPHFGAL